MKSQMKFQKIFSLITLIVSALSFVIAISFCGGIIPAARQYSDAMQGEGEGMFGVNDLCVYANKINDVLAIMGIVLILGAVLLYIMGCNKRRNYYVTNYVAIGVYLAIAAAVAITMLVACGTSLAYVGKIDFEAWKDYEIVFWKGEENIKYYSENYSVMVIGIIYAVALIAVIVLWVLNTIWKIKLMKGEKQLLEQGAVNKVTELEVA